MYQFFYFYFLLFIMSHDVSSNNNYFIYKHDNHNIYNITQRKSIPYLQYCKEYNLSIKKRKSIKQPTHHYQSDINFFSLLCIRLATWISPFCRCHYRTHHE